MNTLLIFFAIPVATVILAIVLQKIIRCPLLVAATFFAIFLIVTFAAFDASFLVFAILYTILSYVTAVLVKVICKAIETWRNWTNGNCRINENPVNIDSSNSCTSINLANDTNLLTSNLPSDTNSLTNNLANDASLLASNLANNVNLLTNNDTVRRTNCNACNARK